MKEDKYLEWKDNLLLEHKYKFKPLIILDIVVIFFEFAFKVKLSKIVNFPQIYIPL